MRGEGRDFAREGAGCELVVGVEDFDQLAGRAGQTLSTSTPHRLQSCLNRAINRAMARDNVRRNVVALCTVPQGRPGRPSKALTLA